MKNVVKYFAVAFALVVALMVGLAAGVALDRVAFTQSAPPGNIPSDATSDFGLMAEAWNVIEKDYVDQAAAQPITLTYGAISGMADALGDTGHTRFLTPEMVKQEASFEQGQYVGIGVEVQIKNGKVVIIAPIPNSPAAKAGLRAGEIILKANGESLDGLTLDQVVSRISGPAGTTVTLTILDPTTDSTQVVTLTRAKIDVQDVTWIQVPGTNIAQVEISAFSQGVTDSLRKALSEIKSQGLAALVLDLRDNPGGLLSEAVGTASQFVTSGNVLLEKNVKGDITPVPVESGGVAPDIPMVVLINAGTASASEIVAGALKDHQRATLVGETTFGTGTVLQQFSLSDGSALLLATEEWLTPDGNTIWHKGLDPDVAVSLPAGAVPLFPTAEQGMTAAQVQSSNDAQLLKALEILQNRTTSMDGSF